MVRSDGKSTTLEIKTKEEVRSQNCLALSVNRGQLLQGPASVLEQYCISRIVPSFFCSKTNPSRVWHLSESMVKRPSDRRRASTGGSVSKYFSCPTAFFTVALSLRN